jgi:hypothetical protein
MEAAFKKIVGKRIRLETVTHLLPKDLRDLWPTSGI